MSDLVTVRAIVGTEPQLSITPQGTSILKFRVATHERKREPESGEWVDASTNWYSVTCFRTLGENAMESLQRGDRIVLFGKLQIRHFERADGTQGTSADIEAYAVGHDLKFGTSNFTKSRYEGSGHERVSHADRQGEDGTLRGAASATGWQQEDEQVA